jgi:phosphoribosylformylglycinamidine synthase
VIKARVTVTLKDGVLDPQGKAIEGALGALGFDGVGHVRQGKVFDLELQTADREKAETQVADMCEKLLANTVIESYSIDIA